MLLKSFAPLAFLLAATNLIWMRVAEAESEKYYDYPRPHYAVMDGSRTFLAYAPKTIRNGFDVTLNVKLVTSLTTTFKIRFQSRDESLILEQTRNLTDGESYVFNLGKVPIDYSGRREFRMEIMAESITGDEIALAMAETEDFQYERKTSSILIQTDKAIYKPGQTVKFRAIGLTPDMKPVVNHTMTYAVLNSDRSIIMLKKHQPVTMGVVFDEVQLHPSTKDGQWMIKFTDENTNLEERIKFDVEGYNLPKFELLMSNPTFISDDMEGINVHVEAKYTFGKPVRGELSCKVSKKIPRYYYGGYYGGYMQPMMYDYAEEVWPMYNPDGTPFVPPPPPGTYEISDFTGEADIFVPKEVLEIVGIIFDYKNDVEVKCTLEEKGTDETAQQKSEFVTTKENVRVEKIFGPDVFKPGLNFTAYVQVSQYDGKLLMDDVRDQNVLDCQMHFASNYNWNAEPPSPPIPAEDYSRTYEIPPSGIIVVDFETPKKPFDWVDVQCKLNGTFENAAIDPYNIRSAESDSLSFLQISRNKNGNAQVGDDAQFTIQTTESVNVTDVLVLNRGRVLVSETLKSDEATTEFSYVLSITHEMQPSVTLLAYYSREDGEQVADYITFQVELSFNHQMKISTSSNQLDAGDHITINVTTSSSEGSSPNFVGIRAVDKSVLLLKKGNDITEQKVKDDLKLYTDSNAYSDDFKWWWWWPMPSGSTNAEKVFDKAGIIVMSDQMVFPEIDHMDYRNGGFVYDMMEEVPMRMMMSAPGPIVPIGEADNYQPRKNFPETWLWLNEFTNDDGVFEYSTKVPDTITSWEISGFSVSEDNGLAVADKARVTVFRNFFVNVNLPLKVIRDEVIIVKATVYNYLDHSVTASVELTLNDKFEFINPLGEDLLAGPSRLLSIPSQDSVTISFPIRMTSIGHVDIKVSAQTEIAYDSLIRTVHVKPEGISQCFSQSTLFNHEESSMTLSKSSLHIKIPTVGVVPGSATANLFVYGDILGNSMNNLGNLLKTPSGCGEQNMVNFAPDIFVTVYLQRSNQLTAENKDKAFKHFTTGLQNELNYQRRDGSFSAFGDRDDEGSLWLTAFVLKCFRYATYMDETIEEQLRMSIHPAKRYIFYQFEWGDHIFREDGQVSHRGLQGGVNSALTLTAYAVIALKEVDSASLELTPEQENVILPAITKNLERNLDSISDKPYDLAIITYALHLLGSSRADEAYRALLSLAVVEETMTYWKEPEEEESSSQLKEEFQPYYSEPSSFDIEMTSYAILTMVHRNEHRRAVPAIRWLASKQNSFGGYGNTQDTVLGIQALASMAEYLIQDSQNLTVIFGQNESKHQVTIDNSNFQVLNRFDLEASNGMIDISAVGNGVSAVQLSVCYNIDESPFTEVPFECNVATMADLFTTTSTVEVCCSSVSPEPTGMLLYKIDIPTGYSINAQMNDQRNYESKLVEFDKGTANLYFDKIGVDDHVCGEIQIDRVDEVAEYKPGLITVMDYYRPKRSLTVDYTIPGLPDLQLCQVCSECVGCAQSESPGIFRMEINPVIIVDDCWSGNCYADDIQPTLKESFWNSESLTVPDTADAVGYCTVMFGANSRPNKHPFPAVDLNNQALQPFINCSQLAENLQSSLETGFTLSFLLYVERWSRGKTKILAYGSTEGREREIMILEKRTNKGVEHVRFTGYFNGRKYMVLNIDPTLLVGKWSHVMITWDADNAHVYIDGNEEGEVSNVETKTVVERRRQFFFGRNGKLNAPLSKPRNRRAFNGAFSTMLFWNQKLSESQVAGTYDLFDELLDWANGEDQPNTNDLEITPLVQKMFNSPLNFDEDCYIKNKSMEEFLNSDTSCFNAV